MLIQSLSVPFRRSCLWKWRLRTKEPCMDKKNCRRGLILMHFRGTMFWHIKKKKSWLEGKYPWRRMTGRLWNHSCNSQRDLMSSTMALITYCHWCALTCLILSNFITLATYLSPETPFPSQLFKISTWRSSCFSLGSFISFL